MAPHRLHLFFAPYAATFLIDGMLILESTAAMPEPGGGAASFTVGCDPWSNLSGFVLDELQISHAEKSSNAIRGSALRKEPFADQ